MFTQCKSSRIREWGLDLHRNQSSMCRAANAETGGGGGAEKGGGRRRE